MITTEIKKIHSFLYRNTAIIPLVVFRIAFGFLMCFSMVRFIYNGWVEECYASEFHFTYYFFDWVKPFDVSIMYFIVALAAIAALFIGLGFLYRVAAVVFFTTFTYLELIEKSWYLNHYYFVSLVAFLLILVPANRNLSIDSKWFPKIERTTVPYWTILLFKVQVCVVYLFGGVAKLKSDWLFEAQPLKIWLKAKTDTPLIGWLFEYDLTPYLFSWSGMFYDLIIPFLLFIRKTRPFAYILVVIFHGLTAILFNIGMFPWLMISASLLFVTHKEWNFISSFFNRSPCETKEETSYKTKRMVLPFLFFFFLLQVLIPLRYHLATTNVLWTENGFRFSWHVMVMEKSGHVEFTVIDRSSGSRWIEYPKNHLTIIQEKQMSFQPDMIWQYAQFLKEKYHQKNSKNVEIYVSSKVSLNGRPSQTFINPKVDIAKVNNLDEMYSFVMKLE